MKFNYKLEAKLKCSRDTMQEIFKKIEEIIKASEAGGEIVGEITARYI